MPYVQRNSKGKITGLYSNSQLGMAEEFLPEEHEEVVEFRKGHPVPDGFLKPLSPKERERADQDQRRIRKEHQELQNAIWAFNRAFSEFEISLSALLYEAMHIEPRSSEIAYAVYFSPDGFHGRIKIIDNVIKQLIHENAKLSVLSAPWETLFDKSRSVRELRNDLAHGTPIVLNIRGKNHVRVTSPVFDVIRVRRPYEKTGDPPGLKTNEIKVGTAKLSWLINRIDETNRAINAFHEDDEKAFSQRLAELKFGLLTSHTP